jgi:hypothetical protein
MVVEVLGTLCVGVAHQSHQAIQMEIANADALPTLVNLMRNCKDLLLQVLYVSIQELNTKYNSCIYSMLELIPVRTIGTGKKLCGFLRV